MIGVKSALVFGACFAICACASVKFPEGFKLCPKDSTFNKCFMDAILLDDKFLKDGGYGKIPATQPVKLGQLKLKFGGEGVGVFLNTVLNDVSFTYDLESISDADVNWEKGGFILDGHFKNIKVKSHHNTTGRFILANVAGAGKFDAYFYDSIVNMKADLADDAEIDGKPHWRLSNLVVKFKKVKKIAVDFDLVNNKDVNTAINRAINDNYEVVLMPLLPTLEKQMSPKIEEHINQFLSSVPRDELFDTT